MWSGPSCTTLGAGVDHRGIADLRSRLVPFRRVFLLGLLRTECVYTYICICAICITHIHICMSNIRLFRDYIEVI